MRRSFVIKIFLLIPLFFAGYGFASAQHAENAPSLIGAVPSLSWGGWPPYLNGISSGVCLTVFIGMAASMPPLYAIAHHRLSSKPHKYGAYFKDTLSC